jgi:outer membrane autotransporter protein
VINQGLITPGNSIGTLHVSGNYTQTAAGSLQIEIDDQGNSDRIAVQGAATIQGGAVNVRSQPGSYAAGSRYTFLTAQSISGQFTSISDDLAFLDVILGYDANSAYFTLLNSDANYVDVAQTHNQFALGTYLDQVAPSANGDLSAVFGQLDTLNADQARNAYSQMDGDFHGSLGQVGVQNTTLILYQLNNRLAAGLLSGDAERYDQASGYNGASAPVVLVRCENAPGGIQLLSRATPPHEPWIGWSMGYGLGGNVQSNGNVSGINYGMGGMLAGIGRYLDDSTLFGFYGGYVGTSVSARDLNQSGSISGGQFGSYLRGDDGFNYYTVIGGFEFDGYRTRRSIAFGGINTAATANYSGWQGYAYGERGVTFGGPRLALQPFGALQYVYLRQNSFNEDGAGVLNLDGRGSDANSLRTFVGGRALFRPHSRLSPQVRAAWVHELLSTSSIVNAHFGAVGGGAFAVQGLSLGRDWALVGGGLNWQLSGGWSLWGNYDAMVNARQVFHVGSGGVQFVW